MATQLYFMCHCLLTGFLQVLGQGNVLSQPLSTSSMLLRSRRANSFLLEELLPGNLERECHEERCSYEEAREFFENSANTIAFWKLYNGNKDQCQTSPCVNGGTCVVRRGVYVCLCTPPYSGPTCQLSVARATNSPPSQPQVTSVSVLQCAAQGPSACHHHCVSSHDSFSCSCTSGYVLQEDGRSCLPSVEYPCGRSGRNQTDRGPPPCADGRCPWQVSLLDGKGVELCGGVVLGSSSVLTAAQCLFPLMTDRLSSLSIHTGEAVVRGSLLYVHERYLEGRHDNDLVLIHLATPLQFGPTLFPACLPAKDFSENVLMRPGRVGLAPPLLLGLAPSPQTRLAPPPQAGLAHPLLLQYGPADSCRQLSPPHPVSNKMFCMSQDGRREASGEARPITGGHGLLPGMPVVTEERGTVFLTGLLLAPGHTPVFTKLSRHLAWLTHRLAQSEGPPMTSQVPQDPPIP